MCWWSNTLCGVACACQSRQLEQAAGAGSWKPVSCAWCADTLGSCSSSPGSQGPVVLHVHAHNGRTLPVLAKTNMAVSLASPQSSPSQHPLAYTFCSCVVHLQFVVVQFGSNCISPSRPCLPVLCSAGSRPSWRGLPPPPVLLHAARAPRARHPCGV